ncbi:family 20 glycosylhydrolase [bacterium]|nr:family 20 glycosylhydrolase [bacterium]
MSSDALALANDLWEANLTRDGTGRILRLVDRATGVVVVQPPAPGQADKLAGLELWTKCGANRDPGTGVLTAFAPIHRAAGTTQRTADRITITSRAAGLVRKLTWSLPPGREPLRCQAVLTNESAPADQFQFEGFFLWDCPPPDRPQRVFWVPDLPPFTPAPYLEVRYAAGAASAPAAAWWRRENQTGIALRAGPGTERFFCGLEWIRFVLGPHSRVARLAPGESLTFECEIAPLSHARAAGWPVEVAAAEQALRETDRQRVEVVRSAGAVAAWASTRAPRFSRRALNVTRNDVPLAAAIRSLEQVAPAGFTVLLLEVGDAFPYRSHPEIVPAWAWSRNQWAEYVSAALDLGLEVIPLINSLGHQTETGLGIHHVALREDPNGWALCPRHPHTLKYLGEMWDEVIEFIQPRTVHVGLDEVDMVNRAQTFRLCPRCRAADAGELFADHICGLHAHLAGRGLEMMMWPDMLFHEEHHNHVNGRRTGIWRAIDRLPRDIIMVDWVYGAVPGYAGTQYLLNQGFRVMGATWNSPRAVANFARFAADHNLYGMCATTWGGMLARNWPLDCVLLAAKLFQDPAVADFDRVAAEAAALAHGMIDQPRSAVP